MSTPATRQQRSTQRLCNRFGGRKEEIASLVQLLGGDQGQLAVDVFVYGGRSTGKTSVVRAVLEDLELRHVFINCRAYTKPAKLLQAAANGLQATPRRPEDNYNPDSSAPKTLPDFLAQLPSICSEDGGPCYIVLDDAQRLAQKPLLAPLLRLRELSGGCNIGVILICSMGWEAFMHDTLAEQAPLPVLFRPYKDHDIMQILLGAQSSQDGEHDARYEAFVRGTMPPFIRATRNLRALHRVASQLFTVYCSFLKDGGTARQENPQVLHRLLRPHVQAALETFQSGTGLCADVAKAATGAVSTAAGRLDFELPYMSKYLLVAAYIASRNRPATDKRVFDISGGRKRRRRSMGAMQADRQVEAAKAAALAGPGSFELERLMAIFWSVLNNNEEEVCSEESAQSSEIPMQISSLVSLQLLSQVSGDDVLDKCKYQCHVSDELAQRVARNLHVDLSNYLTYV